MRIIYLTIIMCLSIQSSYADSIYTFMQFDCDTANNTIEIKEVYAEDYPEFESLNEVSGVLKKDSGIELISNEHGASINEGQLPKTKANCSLRNSKDDKLEVTLSLKDIHFARVRGLCAAATGPVHEVLLNNMLIARFPSGRDRCYPKFNPLDIIRMEYSHGVISLCRIPDYPSSRIQKLTVRWNGEICLSGTPEQIINNQDVMKDFQKELYDDIALEEARRELHIYKNKPASSASPDQVEQQYQKKLGQLNATQKSQTERIVQLEKELKETKSSLTSEKEKTLWQRLFD